MHRAFMSKVGKLCAAYPWLFVGLGVVLTLPGCGHKEEGSAPPSVTEPPTVRLVHPDYRKIVRVVGQPSFVEAYERTSIFPKLTGFISKWNRDIGDKVKKGDILATLYVPELEEDWETKKATVKLDEEKVQLALEVVEVAKADVQAAEARLVEAERILDKYKSEVDRWESEVKRLEKEVQRGVVAPQILLESQNQHRADVAAWESAKATVEKAKAQLLSAKATLKKNIVDVKVARRDVEVATSDAKRMEAWVGYLQLIAPFDGIITRRNANTWDFVLPLTGDPSADQHAPALSPGNKAAPIYVVERTDIVRVFVDIPEADANYVKEGVKAKVQIKGYRDEWIHSTVTRTSWALNVKSRTLRAEIDLPNKGSQILPGMYAYGQVIIERPDVRAVPEAALVRNGDQTYYWSYENGKAKRVEVQTGISDGTWTEITSRQQVAKVPGEDTMVPIDGKEQVILGDLSVLTEGGPVKLADAAGNDKAELK